MDLHVLCRARGASGQHRLPVLTVALTGSAARRRSARSWPTVRTWLARSPFTTWTPSGCCAANSPRSSPPPPRVTNAAAADHLNALLAQHPVHPVLVRHDGPPWHLHLADSGSVADRYAAAAVIGLAAVVAQFGANRLGICAIASCHRVFIDASTNRSRRYCSDHCATRATVTASGPAARPATGYSAATGAQRWSGTPGQAGTGRLTDPAGARASPAALACASDDPAICAPTWPSPVRQQCA